MDNPFVEAFEITFDSTKSEKRYIVLTHNVIWANQKTDLFMCCLQRALATFDAMCFPPIVGASDVISSVLNIHKYLNSWCVNLSFITKCDL